MSENKNKNNTPNIHKTNNNTNKIDGNNEVFDEKIMTLIGKIDIPKNPLSFYINSKKIEKNISESIRNYFYRAINEFITPEATDNKYDVKDRYGYNNFLFKLYYYSGFTDKLAHELNNFINLLKFYDIEFFLRLSILLDSNLKYKLQAILKNKLNALEDINTIYSSKKLEEVLEKYKLEKDINTEKLILNFENYLYNRKVKERENIFNLIEINIPKKPLSYQQTKISFEEYEKTNSYFHYNTIMLCFAKIVKNYDRKNNYNLDFFEKLGLKLYNLKKYNAIKLIIYKNDKYEIGEKLFSSKNIDKNFNSKFELRKYLITYLINTKSNGLKNFFYWEAIKDRLSEDTWASLGGTNLFYLQKIDSNISEFNMLLFFKQFKDTLIDLYDSIFWPFIKPYFYYILVFKSIKLPLKDWQKFFFLLMFFSAESYEEYIILQKIYKNIEIVGLWDFSESKNKIIYYLKRLFGLLKIFFSSIVLGFLLLFTLYFIGFFNILMLLVIFLLLLLTFLKYWLFPSRFEILKNITIISLSILVYIWFVNVFPKISSPNYFNYLGNQVQAVMNLDFEKAKKSYSDMISYIYGKDYKQYENKLLSLIKQSGEKFKNNKTLKEIAQNSSKLGTSILEKYTAKYIKLKKGEYLKKIIDRRIEKLIPGIDIKYKEKISKQVFKEYLKYYCSIKKDYYCKTKLEKLPVGFSINITKIDEFIKKIEKQIIF